MSGVEGVECEDYDDGEVGVGADSKASTTKDTKDHEGKPCLAGLTGGVASVE